MTELHLRAMQVIWRSSKISAYQRRKTNFAKVANLCPAGEIGTSPIGGTSPLVPPQWSRIVQVKRLSPWESWREAPERARTLAEKRRRGDSIALTKRQLIAARRLLGDGLALSVIASQCHLSQRERLWPTGRRKNPPRACAPRGKSFLSGKGCVKQSLITAFTPKI